MSTEPETDINPREEEEKKVEHADSDQGISAECDLDVRDLKQILTEKCKLTQIFLQDIYQHQILLKQSLDKREKYERQLFGIANVITEKQNLINGELKEKENLFSKLQILERELARFREMEVQERKPSRSNSTEDKLSNDHDLLANRKESSDDGGEIGTTEEEDENELTEEDILAKIRKNFEMTDI
eukprot:CAMPEP_0114996436 /NCGR_PEP_ID=MMETSP0216-20121206/14309_1 /TAXON_ID=223996 /ORGANISM="Protocruzia adherens, Strain Boccale" /LENGTH=185 /DNA_ID=CAMNT_0002360639 /DNA_START=9 /DNA_END=566 /DNA_ORIENTATION=+